MAASRPQRFLTLLSATVVAGGVLLAPAAPAAAAAPTAAPALVAPAYNTAVSGNPVLQWAAAAGAVKYRVQVAQSPTFATVLYNVDTSALRATPPSDLPLGPLYWRVAGTDGGSGVGPYSASQFVKNRTAGPTLTAPANGAVLAYPTQSPLLRWAPLTGVKAYRVELDDADDFIGAQAFSTANTSLALTDPLILGKSYHWRVQGVSATTGVTGAFSATWNFQVQWPATAGKPVLVSPANDPAAEVVDVRFRWQPVTGAKNYRIQVNPNPDFTNNMIENRVVDGTEYSPAATYNNATYYWRVQALDTAAGDGHPWPWSDVWQFKRAWTDTPVPLSPINGVSTDQQRFEWSGIPHASYYEFQIDMDANFSEPLVSRCTTYHTTLTPYKKLTSPPGHPTVYPPNPPGYISDCEFGLAPGAHYYWRVRGVDAPTGVNSVFSTAAHFFYEPDVPEMTGPTDGASTAAPVLTWNPVDGYAKYKVTIIRDANSSVTTAMTYGTSYTPTTALPATGGYTWYVVGIDANGYTGRAPGNQAYRHFTLTAPSGSASIGPIAVSAASGIRMPAMSWQPVTNATGYLAYYIRAGSSTAFSFTGTSKLPYPAFTYPGDTLTTGAYQWYVQAFNASGGLLATSATGSFTITDAAFTSYRSPANCTLVSCAAPEPTTPELSWYPVPGAAMYEVWVALDRDFTNIVREYTTQNTSLTPRESYLDSTAGQSYFWFVRPCKLDGRRECGRASGQSLLDHERAFRKQSAGVVLTGPANTVATELPNVVSFSWQEYSQTTNDVTAAKAYRLQVAIDPTFNTVVDEVTVDQPCYQAWGRAYPDNTYYWRVQAIDGGDNPLTWSAVWRFQKVSSVPVPAASGTTTGLPTLSWAAMPYASGYRVEIYRGTDPLFPSAYLVGGATTKLPTYTPTTALPAGQYSWRVRKLDPDGNGGPWSTTLPGSSAVPAFTVSQGAATLSSPADLAVFTSNDLLLNWQAVNGASQYLVETSTSSTFTPAVEQVATVMTSWAPVAAYPDRATYYWRVKVLDGEGNAMATSAVRRFGKDTVVPTVTAVSPTSGLAVDGTLTVTFSEPVRGVSTTGVKLPVAGTTTAVAGTVTPASTATSTTTATFRPATALVPGQSYSLVVGSGITDLAGNRVTARTTALRAALAFENTSPALTERWDTDSDAAASGGAYLSASVAGASATFRFSGTAVTVLGRTSSAGGYADVYLDGVKQTTAISCYSTTTVNQRAVWTRSGLPNAAHTLTVRVRGTAPSGSSGKAVELDAFVAGSTYQETSTAVTTGFARTATSSAAGGSYDSVTQEPDTTGAEYRFTFRGIGFVLTGTRLATGGTATVLIDGVNRGTVSSYAATTQYQAAVYTSPVLTDGVHTVRLVATGARPTGSTGTQVTLDAVTIR